MDGMGWLSRLLRLLRAPNGAKTPSQMDEAPWDNHWMKMVLDGIEWYLMVFDGTRWYRMVLNVSL